MAVDALERVDQVIAGVDGVNAAGDEEAMQDGRRFRTNFAPAGEPVSLAFACLLGILALAGADTLKSAVLDGLGPGMAAALGAEAAMAVAAFLLPTVAMGALFTHLATHALSGGVGFGRALGVNILGAAFAPVGPEYARQDCPVLYSRLSERLGHAGD